MHLLTSETKRLHDQGNEGCFQQIQPSSRTVKSDYEAGTICLGCGSSGYLPTLLISAPEDRLQNQRDTLIHYQMVNRGRSIKLSELSEVCPVSVSYRRGMSKPKKLTTADPLMRQNVPLSLPGICDMYSIIHDRPTTQEDGHTSRDGFLGGKALHTDNSKSRLFHGLKRGAPAEAEEWSQQRSLGKKKPDPHSGRILSLNNPYRHHSAVLPVIPRRISKRLIFPAISPGQPKMEEHNSDSSLTSGSDSGETLPPAAPKCAKTFTGLTVRVAPPEKKKSKTSIGRSKIKHIWNADKPTSRIDRYGSSSKGNGNLKSVCQTEQLLQYLKEAGLNLPIEDNMGSRGYRHHSVIHDCGTRSYSDIWEFIRDSVDLYKDSNKFRTLLNNSNIVIDPSNYDLFERINLVKT